MNDMEEVQLLASMSKDQLFIGIKDALSELAPNKQTAPNVEKARRYAKACCERGFLLSPYEQIVLSVTIYPAIDEFGGEDMADKALHNRLWWGAVGRIKLKQHNDMAALLLGITEILMHINKYRSAKYMLTLAAPYIESGPDVLYYESLTIEIGKRQHPARARYAEISALPLHKK